MKTYDDEPVELFWTADAQFLVDAASRLTSASIPFTTDGAETLNPEARSRAREMEPMAARILVPAAHFDDARSLLDSAGLDPAASGLPEPDDLSDVRAHRNAPRRVPKTFVGRVAWKVFRAFDYVATFLLKVFAYFIAFLASLIGLG